MVKLVYRGHPPGSAVPLPEGWPAADHDESDPEVARAKLASGAYQRERAVKGDKEGTDGNGD